MTNNMNSKTKKIPYGLWTFEKLDHLCPFLKKCRKRCCHAGLEGLRGRGCSKGREDKPCRNEEENREGRG